MKIISVFIRMNILGGLAFSLLIASKGLSQNWEESYGTSRGTIQIKGVYNDTVLVAESQDLIIVLNYETADFLLKLDKSSLRTGIDSLDQKLMSKESDYLEYRGKLGIDYVKIEQHPPMDFLVEGKLTRHNNEELITGTGHLEHIYGDVVSCILNMSFHLSLSEANFIIDLPGLSDKVHIEIVQSVLSQDFGD